MCKSNTEIIKFATNNTITFVGELSWPLGAQELSYPESLDKYRLFAQFLLQGKVYIHLLVLSRKQLDQSVSVSLWMQVIPKLAQFAPFLLTAPVTMMKKWSK